MNKTIIAAAIAIVLASGAKQATAQQAVPPMSVEWC